MKIRICFETAVVLVSVFHQFTQWFLWFFFPCVWILTVRVCVFHQFDAIFEGEKADVYVYCQISCRSERGINFTEPTNVFVALENAQA